jgi:sugar lactone lactonase YvrE
MSKTSMKASALALSVVTAAVTGCASMAPSLPPAPPQVVVDGERVFPESMASAADGSLFFGSIGNKMIYRAAPGSDKAVAFVQPGTDGLQSTFGVFADSRSGTLYACSNAFGGAPGGPPPPPATVYAFDLKTGATKGHYPFATKGGFCNDMATTPDGTLYATDTNNMQVEVLKKGASTLEVWAGADGSLGKRGGVIDGISVLGPRLIVNELAVSKLFSIPIGKDGMAGAPVEVMLDRPISRPDGMRSFGKSAVLIIEGGDGGKLEKVTFDGNNGKVELLKQGYPDGPVAVALVGTTAYVCESQMAAMGRGRPPAPGTTPPPPPVLKPFKATAVEVGKP